MCVNGAIDNIENVGPMMAGGRGYLERGSYISTRIVYFYELASYRFANRDRKSYYRLCSLYDLCRDTFIVAYTCNFMGLCLIYSRHQVAPIPIIK